MATSNKFFGFKRIVRGFTLIELLVVISIIAILLSVATVAYNNIQQKSRDGRRKANLAEIQQALELFYQKNGAYPAEGWGNPPYGRVSCSFKDDGTTAGSGVPVGYDWTCGGVSFLKKMPADPIYDPSNPSAGPFYFYQVAGDFCQDGGDFNYCQLYTIWARLENDKDKNIYQPGSDPVCDKSREGTPDGNGNGIYDDMEIYNYCVHGPNANPRW